MRKLWIGIGIAAVVALAILLVVTYINQTRKESKEIKIGVILPLTGPSALMGETAKNGLLLAQEKINKTGVINGKDLKLIFEDGLADPKTSVSAFNKLVNLDKVKIVIITHSSVGLALAPIADKKKIILLVHASHPKITSSSAYVFRHSNVADQESDIISRFISTALSGRRISLAVMDDDYGMVFKNRFEELIPKEAGNLSIVESIIYEEDESSFNTVAQKLLVAKPDTLIIAGLGNGVGILLRRLQEYGYKGDTIITLGSVITGAFQSAGKAAKGVYYVDFSFVAEEDDYKKLNAEYQKLYKSDIPTTALLFYNSLLLISEAVKSSGYDALNISNFLQSLSSFDGVGEKMTILNRKEIVPQLNVIKR